MVFGGLLGVGVDAAREIVNHDLTPVIHGSDILERLANVSNGREIKIHIKVDTGMGRLGMRPEVVSGFINNLKKYSVKNIKFLLF